MVEALEHHTATGQFPCAPNVISASLADSTTGPPAAAVADACCLLTLWPALPEPPAFFDACS